MLFLLLLLLILPVGRGVRDPSSVDWSSVVSEESLTIIVSSQLPFPNCAAASGIIPRFMFAIEGTATESIAAILWIVDGSCRLRYHRFLR